MDPKWEFNANQFVDFNNLDEQDNSKADEFFDFNMETGERVGKVDLDINDKIDKPIEESSEGFKAVTPVVETKTSKAKNLGTPYIEVTPALDQEQEQVKKPRRLANLVTSWGPGVVKTKTGAGGKTRTSPHVASNGPKLPPKSDYVKQQQTEAAGQLVGQLKVPRVMTPRRAALKAKVEAAVANVRNSPRLAKLTPKRLGTNTEGPRLGRSRTSSARTPELTKYTSKSSAALTKTPDVMKRYRAKLNQGQNVVKQVMDLDSIKSKLSKKGEASTSTLKRQTAGRSSGSGTVSKPTLTLTKPVEFNFATSTRVKSNSASKTSDAPDFSRMLRSYSRKSGEGAGAGITQPIPFNLTAVRKRRHSADTSSNKFKSAAELVQNFQKDTPDRFRTRPRSRTRSVSPGKAQAARLTVPHTPQLMTRGRSRPNHVLSAQEREEQELAEHQSLMFKAKAVGETVPKFKYGDVEKKGCTIPEPFQLHTGSRFPTGVKHDEEEQTQFQAKPLPKHILTGPSGVPDRKTLPIVEPQSPAFALKSRMADRKYKPEPEPEPEPIIRAKPAPHKGVPVLLPPHPRKATLPTPFSFENRDKIMMEKKEEKIKQILEEEKKAREFHAQPIMKEDSVKVPARAPTQATKVEPFKLRIEEKCEERLAKWQEGVEKELEEQRKAAMFKASEPKVLAKAPFQPKPSEKPLSEVGNFMLHSERRALERGAFEVKLKQKEAEIEGAKRELQMRKKREEEEEVARLRREAVPKAQPIRNYKHVEIRPSEKPLTMPASPNFTTKAGNSTVTK